MTALARRLGAMRLRARLALTRARRRAAARIGERLGAWRLPVRERTRRDEGGPAHVAYYLWSFPFLSETFIQREVRAVRAAGVRLTVFADEAWPAGELDEAARELGRTATYLSPIRRPLLLRFTISFLLRRPVRLAALFLWVLTQRYERDRGPARDAETFLKAVYLAGHIEKLRIEHIHAPWATTHAFMALVAARLAGVSYSVQVRAHDLHRADASGLRPKLENARFVVTNTRFNEAHVRSLLPARLGERLHVMRNGLDLDRFPDDRAPAAGTEDLRLLCVARLIEPKGLTVLLRACDLLRARGHRFTCDIVGGREEPLYTGYRVRLLVLHRELRLEDCVRFTGALPHDRVLDAYRRADIFALPCVVASDGSRDITPNALLEAMALALPVVSTTITAIPELVEHGNSGLLVPPDDPVALADALERLIVDPPLRDRLGRRARARVEHRFDMSRNVRVLVGLFEGQPA